VISNDTSLSDSLKSIASFSRCGHVEEYRQTLPEGGKIRSETYALLAIESFVQLVNESNMPAFRLMKSTNGVSRYRMTLVGKRLFDVLTFIRKFDSNHDYTEMPYAFLHACWSTEEFFNIDLYKLVLDPDVLGQRYAIELNWLVSLIRAYSQSKWFTRGISDRQYESKNRSMTIATLVSALLEMYSRLVLVRIDLSYLPEFRSMVGIDRLMKDREEFFRVIRSKYRSYQHLRGYVWAIEVGKKKGPHCHLLFIFDGTHVREDITIGKHLCNIWAQSVTGGLGSTWNCNKKRYLTRGIGVIERADPTACMNAVYFATYLAKDPHMAGVSDPQYVRMKPSGARIFGASQLPENKSARGRPVTKPMLWKPEDLRLLRWPHISSVELAARLPADLGEAPIACVV
jgi:hypothetical protein